MAVFISNSRKKFGHCTEELQNTCLHMSNVTKDRRRKTYVLKWIVENFYELMKEINYSCHYIRIGETLHRLRLLKHDSKYFLATGDRRLMYLLLGLTPAPDTASVTVSFTLQGLGEEEIEPDPRFQGILRSLPDRKCYVEFLESLVYAPVQLVVHCKIVVESNESRTPDVEIERTNTLSPDLRLLLERELYTDITIVAGGKEFRVHRAILGIRSEVFAAMFQNEMKEKSENRVVIEDTDGGTFSELLHFLYTGKTRVLTSNLALSLLPLADKYHVQALESELVEFLQFNMSSETAGHTLLVADMHHHRTLKMRAIEFISDHLSEVMKLPDWDKVRARGDLLEEILRFFA